MDRSKEERKVTRRIFTTRANKLESHILNKELDFAKQAYDSLVDAYDKVKAVDNKILELWLDVPSRNEDEFNEDLDITETYNQRWFSLKHSYLSYIEKQDIAQVYKDDDNFSYRSVGNRSKNIDVSLNKDRHFRLPKLDPPKFDGNAKNWLGFWGQFKKIDKDEHIDLEDKFQFLVQCMETGSGAKELVQSYPPSGDNYRNALEQLKNRYARDEIIIEYYVRELLQLVLAQTKGVPKITTRKLYDKIMTQIQALETMGVTKDKYAAILFPLVESALPEDILRAWNRSRLNSTDNQLEQLLQFLKHEVESEERIQIARAGFTQDIYKEPCTSSAACFATSTEKYSPNPRHSPTIKEKLCIFCEKPSHSSSECVTALRMTLNDRRELLKNKNACFTCLNIGHSYKKCKRYPKCIICSRRHYTIMCSESQSKIAQKQEENQSNSPTVMSRISSKPNTVLLQTIRVDVINGAEKCRVRALIDPGAQRSFVKKDIIDKLKLQPGRTLHRKKYRITYLAELLQKRIKDDHLL